MGCGTSKFEVEEPRKVELEKNGGIEKEVLKTSTLTAEVTTEEIKSNNSQAEVSVERHATRSKTPVSAKRINTEPTIFEEEDAEKRRELETEASGIREKKSNIEETVEDLEKNKEQSGGPAEIVEEGQIDEEHNQNPKEELSEVVAN